VGGVGGDEQLAGSRPGDLDRLRQGVGEERQTVPECGVFDRRLLLRARPGQAQTVYVQVHLRPLRPGERPLVLLPELEPLARMADVEEDPGPIGPTVVLALEEMVE